MRFLIALIAVLSATGCTTPVQVKDKLQPQERIGFLADVSDWPVHTHAASTLYTRDKGTVYPLDWKLTQHITDRFKKELQEKAQFQVINLAEHGFSASDLSGLVTRENLLNPSKQQIIDRLKNELHIRAIVLFRQSGALGLAGQCPNPAMCHIVNNINTGLFTRPKIGNEFFSVADVHADVDLLDEPINLAYFDPLKEANGFYALVKPLTDIKPFTPIKHIQDEEWEIVHTGVEESIDNLVDTVVKELLRIRE